MIPIKLIIEGLYSYKNRQIIDFKKLTTNHIFGIFGNVGSGKSSILEAITFALYGKTDRLLISGDDRNYNMMNLKSNLLFIEFDFYLGIKHIPYKVQVTAKRNSKKFEDVKKADRVIYQKIDNNYTPISQEELENNIGLSYDNFKRTIIIPQGKFQEFLQLKSSERTQMMKELFGLQKFELSSKVKILELKNNAEIQKLNGRLEQLGEISQIKLDDLNHQLNTIKEEVAKTSSLLKKEEETVAYFNRIKEIAEKLEKLRFKYEKIEQNKDAFLKLEKDITDYEYCNIHFKSTIDAINLHRNKVNSINYDITEDQKLLSLDKDKLVKHKQSFNCIKKEYDNIDQFKAEIEALKKLIEVNQLSKNLEKESERLKKGSQIINEISSKIIQLQEDDKFNQDKLDQLKKQLPNIEKLSLAQQWHIKNNNYKKSSSEVESEKKSIEKQISDYNSNLNDQLVKLKISFSSNDQKSWLSELKQKSNDLEFQSIEISQNREKLLIQSGLEKYASELSTGNPCPLCGSKHHPHPFNSKDIGKNLVKLESDINSLNSQIKAYINMYQLIDKHITSIDTLEKQLFSFEKKLNRVRIEQTDHLNTDIGIYQDENLLNAAIKTYKESNEEIFTTEKKLKKIKDDLLTANKNKEIYQEELNKILRNIDKDTSSCEILRSQIPTKLNESKKYCNNNVIRTDAKQLKIKVNEIKLNFERSQKEIENLNKQISIVDGRLTSNFKHLEYENKQLDSLNQKLNTDINNSPYVDITPILNILNLNLDLEDSRQKVKDYYQNSQLIKNELKNLEKELNEKEYDVQKHSNSQKLLKEYKIKLDEANRNLGRVQSLISDLKNKLVLKKELNSALNKLKLRAEDINTLKRLFKSSGFVNYISSVYLQNLCLTANERFYKMTRQSLSLELSEDNSFKVRDFLNGGKLRSIKTLSGGQTFQAALSLALALSDNIQNQNQTEKNFFFLDEGFGSLDKESLEVVFSTLKNLRNENRIVGVISHVEEMQQEISTFLTVKQNEENGSQILESWNR